MEMLETKDFQVADERLAAATHTSTTESLNEDVSPSIISQFDSENELSLMHVQSFQSVFPEVVHDSPLTEDAIDTLEEAGGMIVVQLMDIRTRLSQLRTMLEKRIGSVLTDYEFWLQDSKMLESHKTLVDQCIRGEGVVQVNIQIKPLLKRINIMDVLKPDEECLEPEDMPTYGDDCSSIEEDIPINNTELDNADTLPLLSKSNRDFNNSELNNDRKTLPLKNCQWAIDARFKNDQERLKIPSNPNFWTIPQVTYWIQWAVRQFKLKGIKLSDWRMTGGELCALTIDEFKKKCPNDPVDIFWTHFELLRKCHFIAIYPVIESDDEDTPSVIKKKSRMVPVIENKVLPQYYSNTNTTTTRCGNNGQIQLWQFLLELLTSAEHRNVIQWIGGNGEFKLQNPEVVARLWGQRKNKPTMNYEKLSRALRYYYDGDMIAKVHNKRFVYRFVCDLKQLIGYDASDLARLVNLTNASNKESNSYEYWREPS